MKDFYLVLTIILVLAVIIFIPKFLFTPKFFSDKATDDEYAYAVKGETYSELNPIQRILLKLGGDVKIKEKLGRGKYLVDADILLGIKIATLIITCNSTDAGDCSGIVQH